MKKTSVTYGNDVFDNSHFLIKDDSDVPSGTLNTWVVSMVGRGRYLAFRISSSVFPVFSFSCFWNNQESM